MYEKKLCTICNFVKWSFTVRSKLFRTKSQSEFVNNELTSNESRT